MDAEAKEQKLGKIIVDFKHNLEYLQELVNLGTPLEKALDLKGSIEDVTTWIQDIEKEGKLITDATTQFWGSVVQDKQFEHLNIQMREVEVQLAALRTSLIAMPLVVQVTKEVELKELQQNVLKAQTCQHQCTTQLEEFQDIGEKLSLKAVTALQTVQEG